MRPTHPHTRRYDSLRDLPLISELLERSAQRDHLLVIDGDTRLTARQVLGAAGTFQQLLADQGVVAGDVVSLQLPNWWQTVVAAHAAWGLGAVVNPITPIYRSGDMATLVELARPRAIVVPRTFRGVDYPVLAETALRQVEHTAAIIEIDRDLPFADVHSSEASPWHVCPRDPDDIAMLMFTSGTTGRPKGVLHTHRTLLVESQSIADVFDLDRQRIFMASPLTHITGLLYGVLMPLQIGEAVVLQDQWDPVIAHQIIENTACRATVAATPFLSGLADLHASLGTPSSLKAFVCGGADIPPSLVEHAESVMGTAVSRTYGSTEAPTVCTVRPGTTGAPHDRSEGPVIGEARARIVNVADGIGELQVHGPELFVGYLDPADNEDAFTADGWFQTGDLASIDAEGNISILGRTKDLIIRGGENISAQEIENHLRQIEGVHDCAVIGVPHPVLGETVGAVVVPEPGQDICLSGLTHYLSNVDIARQKWPEAVILVDELPRTASGKVQKFVLRDLAVQRIRAGTAETRSG